jgi:hypothetical protein
MTINLHRLQKDLIFMSINLHENSTMESTISYKNYLNFH